MCICVDCRWVERCQAYHAVERQHRAPHLSREPDFQPRHPRIHVQVLDLPEGGVGVEWDVRSCESFQSDPGRWLRLRPGEALPS
ncbi:MAG: Ycf34 family protein [Cyanobacteriota bacterium]|nr:Ycf34 family protein [Cyanobacteriota bacterium]